MEQITGFGSGVNPPQMVAQMNPNMIDYSKIRVKIVDEPASHKLRFRFSKKMCYFMMGVGTE